MANQTQAGRQGLRTRCSERPRSQAAAQKVKGRPANLRQQESLARARKAGGVVDINHEYPRGPQSSRETEEKRGARPEAHIFTRSPPHSPSNPSALNNGRLHRHLYPLRRHVR